MQNKDHLPSLEALLRCTRCVAAGLFVSVGAGVTHAESAEEFNLEGFASLIEGDARSTAVDDSGTVVLAPKVSTWLEDAESSFAIAVPWRDGIAAASADEAEVYFVSKSGKKEVLFSGTAGIVSALHAKGKDLFIATSPKGKIYRLIAGGKAEVFADVEPEYIWAIESWGDALYVASGNPGKVFSIDRKGTSKEVFDPGQKHLRTLLQVPKQGLFVGGGEKGVVYRSTKAGDTFRALFDTGHPEVTDLLWADGALYVAGVSGAEAVIKATEGSKVKARSQVSRVWLDGRAETVAGSNDEAVFSLGRRGDQVLVATGGTEGDEPRGRVYGISIAERKISLLYQSPERRIMDLVALKSGLGAVSSGHGRVDVLDRDDAASGEYLSAVLKAEGHARFGRVRIRRMGGGELQSFVRTGNTQRADDSWSEWKQVRDGEHGAPAGRFAQVKLLLKRKGKEVPQVQRIRMTYLRTNLRPYVRDIKLFEKGWTLQPMPKSVSESRTIDLSKAEEKGKKDGGEQKERARLVKQKGALSLRWTAEDPNKDELEYRLSFQRTSQPDWRTLAEELPHAFYALDAGQLGDGYYRFRVEASDRPSNPPGKALTDSTESSAVLIDNTPPVWGKLKIKTGRGNARVELDVKESLSGLKDARFSVDGGPMRPIAPVDGILDGPKERFEIELDGLAPGPHHLSLEIYDEGGNAARISRDFSLR